MEHMRRVDVLEPPHDLPDKVLRVLVSELLGGVKDALQVALEEGRDDVERVEVLALGGRRHDVGDEDDVVVVRKVVEELQLAQDAFCINEVLEDARDALDSDLRRGGRRR